MAEIKAGVVVVTKFCKPDNEKYQKYIDYIDREEAVRKQHEAEYDLFADYMDNPEKTTGLFTSTQDRLGIEEKKQLKELFQKAQSNSSLMWQTVISFDHSWLQENGILEENGRLDERALKDITRHAVGKMLRNEGLENAVWSASIHRNTDNIHVHIATVEPEPMREMKEYVQYRNVEKDGNWIREPILGPEGNPIKKKEYVGRFRQKSIELCKSSVVNEIIKEQDNNRIINQIIRENIVQQKRNHPLLRDQRFQQAFLEVYQALPDVERNLWNYNNSIMQPVRPMIDHLTRCYLETYHAEELKELDQLLRTQQKKYERAYGTSGTLRDYRETKLAELYTRMGNTILKEMRKFDKNGTGENGIGSTIKDRESGYHQRRNRRYLLGSSLRSLKRSLKKDFENERNEREHERLAMGNSREYWKN